MPEVDKPEVDKPEVDKPEVDKPEVNKPEANKPDKNWLPSATFEALRQRADLLASIRQYFAESGVLEVETPILTSATIPDPNIPSFATDSGSLDENAGDLRRFLNTSPEFAMKRLLAAGSGSIYQICKAFRQGEQGRLHNPEFTLLEWYRPGWDHHRLMDEVTKLVTLLSEGHRSFEGEERLTYRDCFQQYLGLDPFEADIQQMKVCAKEQGLDLVTGLGNNDPDGWLDLLLSHCIQPHLGKQRLTYIYDYPVSQAALAKISPRSPPVASRFELFVDGIELANGFHELQDAKEQQCRFEEDLAKRRVDGLPPVPLDNYFLSALESGMPDCAGVALGVDRLQVVLTGAEEISNVLSFSYSRI